MEMTWLKLAIYFLSTTELGSEIYEFVSSCPSEAQTQVQQNTLSLPSKTIFIQAAKTSCLFIAGCFSLERHQFQSSDLSRIQAYLQSF